MRFAEVADEVGLPLRRQVRLGGDEDAIGRVDFYDPVRRKAWEILGDAWHLAVLAQGDDAERKRELRAVGVDVDFVSESEIIFRKDALRRRLLAELGCELRPR
jgi:hypothetical protein